MRPCPKPLIRIIIDDEDGELPSINISPQLDEDEQHSDHSDMSDEEEDDDHHRHYHESPGHSLSSSVDSFIQHLDSLHPFRLSPVYSCCLAVLLFGWATNSVLDNNKITFDTASAVGQGGWEEEQK